MFASEMILGKMAKTKNLKRLFFVLGTSNGVRKNGTAVLRTVYFLISECVNTSHGRTVVISSIHISSLL
jgi:hypothetical protein